MSANQFEPYFVWTNDLYVIGKCLGEEGTDCLVERFHSVVARDTVRLPASSIQRIIRLPTQARAYFIDADAGRWCIGRISEYADGSYVIRLPNKRERTVSVNDLHIRVVRPVQDPTDVLASRSAESEFLYEMRLPLARLSVRARALSDGLSSALSSFIDYVPYQLAATRRVLEDPVPRYLLADEVGLGKTIEAGLIIKHWLADDPSLRVLVSVPEALLVQWKQELVEHFAIHTAKAPWCQFVTLVSHDGLLAQEPGDWDAMVIDEAHLLLNQSDGAGDGPRYTASMRIGAHEACQRVLLISATPVVGDEQRAYSLLRLLDPIAHPSSGFEAFRLRVHSREKLAEMLAALNAQMPEALLAGAVAEIASHITADVARHAKLEMVCERGVTRQEREARVGLARTVIGDAYRPFPRMIRTRRSFARGVHWEARSAGLHTEKPMVHSRMSHAARCIAGWRRQVVEALGHGNLPGDEGHRQRCDAAAAVYSGFLEAFGQSLANFDVRVADRLATIASGAPAHYRDEVRELQDMRFNEAEQRDDRVSRVRSIHHAIHGLYDRWCRQQQAGEAPRCYRVVVFSTDPLLVLEMVRMANGLGLPGWLADGVAISVRASEGASTIAQSIHRFSTCAPRNGGRAVAQLLCDATGEVGFNLQSADAIIHCDLPLDINRVEQRIGRLDRYGRSSRAIDQIIMLWPEADEENPWRDWWQMLDDDGIGIFDKSISDVWYFMEDFQQQAKQGLFWRPRPDIAQFLAASFTGQVREQRSRIDLFDLLERADDQLEEASRLSDELRAFDAADGELADAFEAYAQKSRSFHFDRDSGHLPPNVFTLSWSQHTLLPLEIWERASYPVRSLGRQWLTPSRASYGRLRSRKIPHDAQLLRPGHPLFDFVGRIMRSDDAGTSYATWRVRPDWEGREITTFFRLDFVVEAGAGLDDVDPVRASAVRRRADALFPPSFETLYFNSDFTIVEEELTISILQSRYFKSDALNLGSKPDLFRLVIDDQPLQTACERARTGAETLLRTSPEFVSRLERAKRDAQQQLSVAKARIDRRAGVNRADQPDADLTHFDRELQLVEDVRRAVSSPVIRVDSIGFHVISTVEQREQAMTLVGPQDSDVDGY